MYYNIQLQQQQQEVHNSLYRFYISYKFSVKAWCEPKVTPYSTTLLVDTRSTTSWRRWHQESYYTWEPCRHLHQTTSCTCSTKTSTSKWSSSTTRRRGGRRVHVLPQEQKEAQQEQKHWWQWQQIFRQSHYNNMHKTVEQHKKPNVELQRLVEDLQLLVGERDAEVRDLAYRDLLPDQILRAQHALLALQDHLTEQHMRQLLGTEPLQAILAVIVKRSSTTTSPTRFKWLIAWILLQHYNNRNRRRKKKTILKEYQYNKEHRKY